MQGLLWPTIAGVVLVSLATQFVTKAVDRKPASENSATAAAASPPTASRAGLNTVAVPSDRGGHFRVNANVGGRRVDFLVDTGASIIALKREDASRLGINPAKKDYTARISTANGIVQAAPVRLASVEVGSVKVQDVTAVVMPDGVLGENLLGMSFLSRIRRFEFRTGQLVLEQ